MCETDSPRAVDDRRAKLAFLTNFVAPYAVCVLDRLGEAFETVVLYSSLEPNRAGWRHVSDKLSNCRVRKSFGVCLPFRQRRKGMVYENRHLHITPGYLIDLLRENPDGVLSIEMGFRTLAAVLYTWLFRKPLWISWKSTPHTERAISWWKVSVRRWLARRNVRWITYGMASTEYLVSLGVARDRIVQTQNCVDEGEFTPVSQARFSLNPHPVVLTVGRLVALKGLDALLLAAAKVKAAGHVFSLLIVGEGPEEANLRRLAGQLRLRNVHFQPNQPPEVMAEVYRSADVFVFPTLNDVWGLVVNEALLCSIPVLCSIYAGCAQDIVPPGNRFDPKNASDFESALARAVSGRLAPPDVSPLWPSRAVADAIIADIRTVLSSRSVLSTESVDSTIAASGNLS